jgi:uncharacterized phage protein gp47/JayE
MPYARKTLTQLRDIAIETVAASSIYDSTTGQVVNPVLLQFDPLTIQAKVMAGLAYEEFGYIDYISLQATPFTAVDEIALGWGGLVSVTQEPATAATGIATFTGTVGTDIPLNTQLVRSDGVTYVTTADVIVDNTGTALLPYQASATGATTTIANGATLTLANPIAGINPTGVVSSALTPGSDIETIDAFKTRYLQRYAAPPQGGASSDYVIWALAVPGITRAWTQGDYKGPGTVGVYVMLDVSEAGNNGFPSGTTGISPLDNNSNPRATTIATGDLLTVANALIPLQPVTAVVWAVAPGRWPVNFNIQNLGSANTATIQAEITAALAGVMVALGDPRGMTIYSSSWNNAIASVAGVTTFTLISPTLPFVIGAGFLPTVGTIAFSA